MAKKSAALVIDEMPPAIVPFTLELPRLLHKDGDHRRVDTPEDCEQAMREGWTVRPEVVHG